MNALNISATQQGFNGNPITVGSVDGILKAWQTDGRGRFINTITYGNGWNSMRLTGITGDVNGDGVSDMWAVTKTGELRLYVAKDTSGTNFTSYVTGSGWSGVKYFLPRVDNARVVRAIFLDGNLSQYTLQNFKPTTTIACPSNITVTASHTNALKAAQNYLSWLAMSKEGLISQLKYDKYSDCVAKWAVDRLKIDWNKQAIEKARSYLSLVNAFSTRTY